jgi:hypothetical protein
MAFPIDELNRRLAGFTDVMEMALRWNYASCGYDLSIVLSHQIDARTLTLRCSNVSQLRLSDFGGGITQFLGLQGEDVTAHQLEIIRFRFVDSEYREIEFACAEATLDTQ